MFNSTAFANAGRPEPTPVIDVLPEIDQVVEQMETYVQTNNPKFGRFSVLRHYKGGIYYTVGLPSEIVSEDTRKPAYSYLMSDGRICIREQEDMETAGKFEVMSTIDILELPEGTLEFIVSWHESEIRKHIDGHAKHLVNVKIGSVGPN